MQFWTSLEADLVVIETFIKILFFMIASCGSSIVIFILFMYAYQI